MLTRTVLAVAAGAAVLALGGVTAPAALAARTVPPHRATPPGAVMAPGLVVAAGRAGQAGPAGPGVSRAAGRQLVTELRQAWRITKGKGVTVAVVGGTVDRTASGLAGRVVTGPRYGRLSAGQVTDGTLFASAVAGGGPDRRNPAGTLGLAPQARILSLGVQATARTPAWLADVGRAIRYAVAHGAGIIYVEQVSYSDSASLATAVGYALAKNVVVVSAEYGPARLAADPEYPASLPGVIAAGSVTLPGLARPPSRYPSPANGSILVTAPGNVLDASGPAGTHYPVYNFFAAGAWLTATAALIESAHPHLPPSLVARAIAGSAMDRPAGGYSPSGGFGLLDPAGALAEASRLAALRTAAFPAPGSVPMSASFASGAAPGAIQAVHHSAWKLTGCALLMLAGLVVLLRARRLGKRWRRRARLPTAQSHRMAHD